MLKHDTFGSHPEFCFPRRTWGIPLISMQIFVLGKDTNIFAAFFLFMAYGGDFDVQQEMISGELCQNHIKHTNLINFFIN